MIGYRELTDKETKAINEIKDISEMVRVVWEAIGNEIDDVDRRWLAEARTDLQKGFMSMIRSVERPDTF